ncbi:MAG: Bro-N domain-containing protein [Nitrospiria bacterium]
MKTNIAIFRGREIRKTIHNNEWWFSVIDVVEILTGTDRPRKYWSDLKKKIISEGYAEVSEKIGQLKMEAPDGKMRQTDCANTETMFRIIQSIPSPKAEPFKRWLAKVGYERVQEIEDPELATKRTRALYKAKGYSDDWIEKRMRGIAIREELTDEWKKREVKERKEYEILTAEIAKAAFGVTPSQHKNLKGLKRENLRDHMTDLELIFSMLGEAATTEITRVDDVRGFHESKTAARKGGGVASKARKDLEEKTGKGVVSKENYLTTPEGKKRLAKK